MATAQAIFDLKTYPGHCVRMDTRIYFSAIGVGGSCKGSVVMENPGNRPDGVLNSGTHIFRDSTVDILIDLVDRIGTQAKVIGKAILPMDYIEVLNLYYFCNSDSLVSAGPWFTLGCDTVAAINPPTNKASRFRFLAWGSRPHHDLSLSNPIRDACSGSIPTYMVEEDTWLVKPSYGVPVRHPAHPRRFLYGKGRKAKILQDIAVVAASHL